VERWRERERGREAERERGREGERERGREADGGRSTAPRSGVPGRWRSVYVHRAFYAYYIDVVQHTQGSPPPRNHAGACMCGADDLMIPKRVCALGHRAAMLMSVPG
jgi:hypothetical protein